MHLDMKNLKKNNNNNWVSKSEVDCLPTYEIEMFEFLLGMTIWYDTLFVVNFVNKNFQTKDMHIDVAID